MIDMMGYSPEIEELRIMRIKAMERMEKAALDFACARGGKLDIEEQIVDRLLRDIGIKKGDKVEVDVGGGTEVCIYEGTGRWAWDNELTIRLRRFTAKGKPRRDIEWCGFRVVDNMRPIESS